MNRRSRLRVQIGAAALGLGALTFYGCKDFLEEAAEPQGTLSGETLATPAGVEGGLIAAYRTLDCTDQTNQNWGCAASNWVWGNVTSDDAYKGSEASDQPAINDIEAYHWSTAGTESYLNTKWRHVYEGVTRANAALRLLRQVVATSPPGTISTADARGVDRGTYPSNRVFSIGIVTSF